MNPGLIIYTLSDSVGNTAINVAKSALAQFPSHMVPIKNFPFIKDDQELLAILTRAKDREAMVIYNFAKLDHVSLVESFQEEHDLFAFNLLTPLTEYLADRIGHAPSQEAGANHQLNQAYFDRINAMEFAVQYDDGQDPNGFLQADIILLGVSRTSKTPLSIYLANEGFKVANLPVMPESTIPNQIYQVDPRKIIGLTNSKDLLLAIRKERMRAYGLDDNMLYSTQERIEAELDFANQLYQDLGCFTINVSNKSIEETTAIIKDYLSQEE